MDPIPAETDEAGPSPPGPPSVFGSLATAGVAGRVALGFLGCWCLCLCECERERTYLRKSMTDSAKLPIKTKALLA